MPPEVVQFLDKSLEPRLRQTDAGRADLAILTNARDRWPDYPKMIVEMARRYKLSIPGWTLPGPAGAWDHFRGGKARPK